MNTLHNLRYLRHLAFLNTVLNKSRSRKKVKHELTKEEYLRRGETNE